MKQGWVWRVWDFGLAFSFDFLGAQGCLEIEGEVLSLGLTPLRYFGLIGCGV